MRNFRNIFVLGGTGYIGSHLVSHLAADRNVKLSLLLHRSPPLPSWPDRIRYVYGSLTDRPWRSWKSHEIPDLLFHFARIPGKRKIGRTVAAWQSQRINQDLVDWLRTQNQPPLLVLIAGTLAYGSSGDEWIDENSPLLPIGYARDYARGEAPIVAALSTGLPIMVLRAPLVYGSGSWFLRFFYQPIVERRVVPLYGHGQQWMSFIHVRDCARLILYFAQNRSLGSTYNLFIGSPCQQKDFVALLARKLALPIARVSFVQLAARHGWAAAEALTFSCRLKRSPADLLAGFQSLFPSLESGLYDLLSDLSVAAGSATFRR